MKSMTGYGHQVNDYEQRRYTVEIRTVNHKYHDISLKMSRNISYLECKVRNKLKDTIQRGKIDVSITMEDIYKQCLIYKKIITLILPSTWLIF